MSGPRPRHDGPPIGDEIEMALVRGLSAAADGIVPGPGLPGAVPALARRRRQRTAFAGAGAAFALILGLVLAAGTLRPTLESGETVTSMRVASAPGGTAPGGDGTGPSSPVPSFSRVPDAPWGAAQQPFQPVPLPDAVPIRTRMGLADLDGYDPIYAYDDTQLLGIGRFGLDAGIDENRRAMDLTGCCVGSAVYWSDTDDLSSPWFMVTTFGLPADPALAPADTEVPFGAGRRLDYDGGVGWFPVEETEVQRFAFKRSDGASGIIHAEGVPDETLAAIAADAQPGPRGGLRPDPVPDGFVLSEAEEAPVVMDAETEGRVVSEAGYGSPDGLLTITVITGDRQTLTKLVKQSLPNAVDLAGRQMLGNPGVVVRSNDDWTGAYWVQPGAGVVSVQGLRAEEVDAVLGATVVLTPEQWRTLTLDHPAHVDGVELAPSGA